ncbi:photosystem I subunit VII, chloroplast [Artemisia annua]|uniref:Photosystem I subunit VII, chloroplast n=1 Tax=Artemisia annua TaxID=35608 RepID=A0A2U1NSQ4_ARTAN|nr:photosystem I subunit VII, chloroplast [Artemisia annua]
MSHSVKIYDTCIGCTQCVRACPTDQLEENKKLKCIRLTVEMPGEIAHFSRLLITAAFKQNYTPFTPNEKPL